MAHKKHHAGHGGHKMQGHEHSGSHGYDLDSNEHRPAKTKSAASHPKANETGHLNRGAHMHIGSHGKHDEMAHPSFHAANKEHGLDMGFAPAEGYMDGGCDHHLGDNVAHED